MGSAARRAGLSETIARLDLTHVLEGINIELANSQDHRVRATESFVSAMCSLVTAGMSGGLGHVTAPFWDVSEERFAGRCERVQQV